MSPPAARLEAGAPGSACDATFHFPPGTVKMEAKPGELVKDIFWGEHTTAYNVKGRGLVVISSCGHAGIINSVRQIQKSTRIEKVHAVVGGWHLAPYPDELIAKTVAAMKEINPDYLIPMHCTGFRTIMAIQRGMPEKVNHAFHRHARRLRRLAPIPALAEAQGPLSLALPSPLSNLKFPI